jgi:hypothetical protein
VAVVVSITSTTVLSLVFFFCLVVIRVVLVFIQSAVSCRVFVAVSSCVKILTLVCGWSVSGVIAVTASSSCSDFRFR